MIGRTDEHNLRLKSVGLAGLTSKEEFDYWGTKESGLASYEDTFRQILRGKHILEMVSNCPKPHLIIDLFSYGFATYELPNVHSMSVALTKRPLPDTNTFSHLTGDIEDPYTWLMLGELAKKANPKIGKASAILSRQLRGDVATFNTVQSTNRFVANAYSLLDYNGFALLQVPELSSDLYQNWIDKLRMEGVNASYQHANKAIGLEEAVFFQHQLGLDALPAIG